MRTYRSAMSLALVMVFVAAFIGAGCATKAQTGSLAGAGVGALIGQVIGRNTAGTLIGTAAGIGAGYIIGNEMDKADAKKRHAKGLPPETGPLAGTKWKAVKVTPAPKPPYKTYIVEFTNDGWLNTTETFADGTKKTDREHYRVKGDILIINKPGYLINANYAIKGNRMTINSQDFSAEFVRI